MFTIDVKVAPVHAFPGQFEWLLLDVGYLADALDDPRLLIFIVPQSGSLIPVVVLLDEVFPILDHLPIRTRLWRSVPFLLLLGKVVIKHLLLLGMGDDPLFNFLLLFGLLCLLGLGLLLLLFLSQLHGLKS